MSRLADHAAVSTALSLLGDNELRTLVDNAPVVHEGIGGTAVRLTVEGRDVFVKRVALTTLERQGRNVRSTANLFGLPPWFHYGLGSAGFGGWRELAAHVMATDWVIAGRTAAFPLLHHWRALDQEPRAVDLAEVERTVAFWDGLPSVRHRVEALAVATSALVLFLEHFPYTLDEWAGRHGVGGFVEKDLLDGLDFLRGNGLWHFDTHLGNILTDGGRLYFCDFGLACSTRFALDPHEREFLDRNVAHDRDYAIRCLVDRVLRTACGDDRERADAVLRRCAETGDSPDLAGIPEADADVVRRHARTALRMKRFYHDLVVESRRTPYPDA
ncbi:hypothetical protein GCM10022243_29930 [Saccharothrix violaceirubra]|uniref:Protein kinase domain-containing protein n=1 Tax=Saccharothrix violaceirubra TaxID=413306 RepID=A0A7W7WX24_9PSEU|nr:protein kinase family protein [Saccharothrix violaceirubra]MBB4966617.1 hypothetical protein [Saccharothrix violaceirubra]